jgi:glycosyltransferase involved in cell wall biosynthesis
MRLSVLIPVYNERDTIETVLAAVRAVLPDVEKEIIIVDDRSTDGTDERLRAVLGESRGNQPSSSIQILFHERNRGKGGAIQTALAHATGEIVIIQDADLEYDPQDWVGMYDLIARRKVADVVYGSRFYGRPHRSLFFHHFLANRLISFLFNVLYNQTLSDIEVGYKMFKRALLDGRPLTCNDFGIEIELSARFARNRALRIYEIGISYFGRTYAEGKKVDWRDGVKALWYLFKFRF